jgi:hypothetical protein
MRVAIHQPNYAPWCGYFAKMAAADVFVFLDDAQMPGGQSFVYRCAIRGQGGPQWLSVPVKRSLTSRIDEVGFGDPRWAGKHVKTLRSIYGRAPHFGEVMELLEPLYGSPGASLAELNIRLITAIAGYLGLRCRFERASRFAAAGTSDDRLIELARRAGATTYVSGKGGQNYQDPEKFAAAGIALEVRVYRPIAYPQIHGGFLPGLSVLDALFHLGPEAAGLMRYDEAEVRIQP